MKDQSNIEIIKFIRRHDYQFVRELGSGACGRTVLLYDDQINEFFVCKKFAPYSEKQHSTLFSNFVREAKILHQVYHENVLRVFNYHLYFDEYTGFILMEFIDGTTIGDYLGKHPEMVNELFLQAISGFCYLEANNILHRDIRPGNLMVRDDGMLKIIDFGFGKVVSKSDDFDKSITLNWWCEKPAEFHEQVYDFGTEVYFVGKLFERFIRENNIGQFKYKSMLARMCKIDPRARVRCFADVMKAIQNDMFFQIDFGEEEMACYRKFADSLEQYIAKIENEAGYVDDVDKVIKSLDNVYRKFMLEEIVPDSALVMRCILKGSYYYHKKGIKVEVVRDFLHMIKSLLPERKRIVLSNLHTRLDTITRYAKSDDWQKDELPF